jgi:UDP-3-O-acyl N-acetylglucosamine deacetylase
VEFRPAAPDTGIVFVRSDLDSPRRIPALVHQRIEVPRRTCLSAGGVLVEMVEHILAALAGLGIDNCEVWTDRPEMPGFDGSCQPFVDVLQPAGVVALPVCRRQLVVQQTHRVGDESSWVEARPSWTGGLTIRCLIDYGHHSPIGRQSLELAVTPAAFCREVAAARTFLLEDEAAWLQAQGLGTRVTCQDLLVFGSHGPLGNTLRYPDECVRHKVLDMIGDLALAGCDLVGEFIAHCSGHRLNADLVRSLLDRQAQGLRRTA